MARRGPCLRIQAADNGGFGDVGEAEVAAAGVASQPGESLGKVYARAPPDMSMTPAPVTPAICGNMAHSRAADNPSPPAPSSAKIRRSRSPGISGTPAPARVRPAVGSAETTHLLAPSPKEGSVSKDWTQRLLKPGTPGR